MPVPAELQQIAALLSERLATWQARATTLVASGYEFPHWNGRHVIRMEIRPELAARVDRDWDLFSQENGLLIQLERHCPECFSWDDGRYAEPRLLGGNGISHYLCDLARADRLIEAISAHQALTPERRERIALELTGRQAA